MCCMGQYLSYCFFLSFPCEVSHVCACSLRFPGAKPLCNRGLLKGGGYLRCQSCGQSSGTYWPSTALLTSAVGEMWTSWQIIVNVIDYTWLFLLMFTEEDVLSGGLGDVEAVAWVTTVVTGLNPALLLWHWIEAKRDKQQRETRVVHNVEEKTWYFFFIILLLLKQVLSWEDEYNQFTLIFCIHWLHIMSLATGSMVAMVMENKKILWSLRACRREWCHFSLWEMTSFFLWTSGFTCYFFTSRSLETFLPK